MNEAMGRTVRTAPDGAVETAIAIRWRDLDAYAHVNNAVYLTYLEEARDAALKHLLRHLPDKVDFVLARLAIDFKREIRADDGPIVAACAIERVGTASPGTRETIRTAAGALAAEAEGVVVKIDGQTHRPAPWTETEREALRADRT